MTAGAPRRAGGSRADPLGTLGRRRFPPAEGDVDDVRRFGTGLRRGPFAAGPAPSPVVAVGVAVAAGLAAGWLLGRGMSRVQFSAGWGWVRELAAPWAVAAFLVGCTTPVAFASAAGGWACISAAVVAFYGLTSEPLSTWADLGPWPVGLLAVAAVVGPVLGALGAAWRRRVPWWWLPAGAVPGLLCAEGAALAWRPPTGLVSPSRFLVEAAVGAGLAAALARRPRWVPAALAAAAAVTVLGVVAEGATGIVTLLYER